MLRDLALLASLSAVLGAKVCIPPTSGIRAEIPDTWKWFWRSPFDLDAATGYQDQKSIVPEVEACMGRADLDAATYDDCSSACQALPGPGVSNPRVACQTQTNLDTNQEVFTGLQTYNIIGSKAFVYSPVMYDSGTWRGPGCSQSAGIKNGGGNYALSGEGHNQPGQFDWDGEGNNVGKPVTAAVWVLGNEFDTPGAYAPVDRTPPYLIPIDPEAPNPGDIFCICQWDPFEEPDATPTPCDTADPASACYTNSDAVSKASANAVAAAVGLGTGILVAVIVVPILALVLLIVGIVCCCKHCGNSKPSA